MVWIHLTPDNYVWRLILNTFFRKMQGMSLLTEELLSSQEGRCPIELVF
jgi:hypothetical protein